jgi:hypothetical protein
VEQDQEREHVRIHLVALPHTQLTRDYDYCAYTAKIRRMAAMLLACGHTPIIYGPEEHDTPDANYVPIIDSSDRQKWFGAPTWDRDRVFDLWEPGADHWRQMGMRAAVAIATSWQPGDIVGLIAGASQQIVLDLLGAAGLTPLAWEWGIGYSGILASTHHTYESYAWAHHVAGLQHHDDLHYFDSVVPNCYDPHDFTPTTTPGDYLLYMGRPTPRKGLPILAELAKHTTVPIKVAGQPGADIPGTEYVGLVTGKDKAELLAGAAALLAPTTYLEPYGGVAVEAMMSGTPAITTDWGGFTETVQHATTGFRCRTLRDFLDAIDAAPDLDRAAITDYATGRYSLTAGARMYGAVIGKLTTLHGNGWYAL